MKVIFLNTHSVLNSGDTGIVLAQIQYLKRYFPGLDLALTSRTVKIDKKLYGSMGIRVFPPLIPAPSVFSGNIYKMQQCLKNLFAFISKRNLIRAIGKSDLVISSGGGYFYSNRRIFPGPMFFQNLLHLKVSILLNKPLVFFPQSFGPFYNPIAPQMLKNILESEAVIKIFAREKISFDLLENLVKVRKSKEKIDVCPDITFYLKNRQFRCDSQIKLNLPKPIVAITLRQWDFPETQEIKEREKKQEEYLLSFQEICEKIFCTWNGSLVIFPQVRGPGIFENDRIISVKLWKRLKRIIPEEHIQYIDFPDAVYPYSINQILSQVDLAISTRLHHAIFALISSVPVIAIAYQPKSRGIMELLGLEKFCIDMADMNPERILKIIEEILNRHAEIQMKIRDKVAFSKKKIEIKLDETIKSIL
jgi:colanic acid/amylovoran biosynthesis protein